MVKLGTLYPDGRVDDLGSVNGGLKPGEDSARRAEEYGWEVWLDSDDSVFHIAKRVEETGDMRYIFAIEVTDMGACCGGESMKTLYYSEELEETEEEQTHPRHFEDKEMLRKLLLEHPNSEAKILEWYDEPGFTADSPNYGDEAWEWAEEMIEEAEYSEIYTALLVIPISMSEAAIKRTLGDSCFSEEDWEDRKKEYAEHGDWRTLAWDIAMSWKIQVAHWSSYAEAGEWAPEDLEKAKMAALQVSMMFGFFMDNPVNAIGETGWDWARNAGVIFVGDEVIVEDDSKIIDPEDPELKIVAPFYVISRDPDENTYTLEDSEGAEFEMPVDAIRGLNFQEQLRRRLDAQAKDSRAEEDSAEEKEER